MNIDEPIVALENNKPKGDKHQKQDYKRNINNFESKITEEKPKNFIYLEESVREQIGLPLRKPSKTKIFNFDNVLIANGYNDVVVTLQGLFWEIDHDDIAFWNLSRDQRHNSEAQAWLAKGVRIFKLTKPDFRRKPRPHRFAVNPPDGFRHQCNPLKVGKYYVHIYQTKVEVGVKDRRTLQSRKMAQELKRIFGTEYNSRPGDIEQRPIGMNEQSVFRISSNNMGKVEAPMNWVPIAQFPNIKP